jgi:hypothetical protein
MATRRPAGPVHEAVAAIKAILDGLTVEEKKATERRLFTTLGYFDEARELSSRLRTENARMKWLLRGRRTADAELDREVVRLRDVEGKSFGDIALDVAEITGKPCSYQAAYKRYIRAKARIRTERDLAPKRRGRANG